MPQCGTNYNGAKRHRHLVFAFLHDWLLGHGFLACSFSEKRRKPSPSAGGDIRRKARRALKINQALTGSERRL